MHISDAGSIVQVKDENRRNTDVFQGLRTQNWAIETSQNAQIISRLFFRLLPAQAFMLALNGLNNMIDGLVGSNFVGAKAMSAIGIYTPLQMACMAVSMILMASSQVLCGRYMGEGRMEKSGAYSR